MKKYKLALLVLLTLVFNACAQQERTAFEKETLAEKFETLEGKEITFEKILEQHKGQTIVIDVWASWCSDCLKGLPLVKKLQEQTVNNNVVYVFLSVDRKKENWKNTIVKRNIVGEHFFVPSGMKGSFGKAINLDWIPRYIVVGKDGNIKLYKAIKADDSKILEAIKADK